MIRRTAEGLVRFQQIANIKSVNYAAQKTNMMRFRDFFGSLAKPCVEKLV